MEETLAKHETAKLAKEKGFPQAGYVCYRNDGRKTNYSQQAHGVYLAHPLIKYNPFKDFSCVAPTQSFLQKWLMEEHSMFIESKQTSLGDTEWKVVDSYGAILVKPEIWPYYDGYPIKGHMFEESGYEITLQEALKLIK